MTNIRDCKSDQLKQIHDTLEKKIFEDYTGTKDEILLFQDIARELYLRKLKI